ncbi:hypothetical protein OAN22_01880 [Alphaproteobacteria bacterium]|nr:hypothetical protein [Alphaproteobacteria bacterium]
MKNIKFLFSTAVLFTMADIHITLGTSQPASSTGHQERSFEEKRLQEMKLGRHFTKSHKMTAKDVKKAYEATGRQLISPVTQHFQLLPPSSYDGTQQIGTDGSPIPHIDPNTTDVLLNGAMKTIFEKEDMPGDLSDTTPLDKAPIIVSRIGDNVFFFQLVQETVSKGDFDFIPLAKVMLREANDGPIAPEDFTKNPDKFEVDSTQIYPGFFSKPILNNLKSGDINLEPGKIVAQFVNFARPFLQKHGADSSHSYNTENSWNHPHHSDNEKENIMLAFDSDFMLLTALFATLFNKAEGDESAKGRAIFPMIDMLPHKFKGAYKKWLETSTTAKKFVESIKDEPGEAGSIKWLKKKMVDTSEFNGV